MVLDFWIGHSEVPFFLVTFGQKCPFSDQNKWHFEWPNQNSKTTFIVQTFPKYGPYGFYFMDLSLLSVILAMFQFCWFSCLFWPFSPYLNQCEIIMRGNSGPTDWASLWPTKLQSKPLQFLLNLCVHLDNCFIAVIQTLNRYFWKRELVARWDFKNSVYLVSPCCQLFPFQLSPSLQSAFPTDNFNVFSPKLHFTSIIHGCLSQSPL